MIVTARLVQKHNDKTGKEEYALISKHTGRVLKWFGVQKPSHERVAKEERRIQYYKHAGGGVDKFGEVVDDRFEEIPRNEWDATPHVPYSFQYPIGFPLSDGYYDSKDMRGEWEKTPKFKRPIPETHYPMVAAILADLMSEMKEKLKVYVARMEQGQQVSMPEDEYDLLIEYTTDHPHSLKLASVWDPKIPGNLLAFFKGLTFKPMPDFSTVAAPLPKETKPEQWDRTFHRIASVRPGKRLGVEFKTYVQFHRKEFPRGKMIGAEDVVKALDLSPEEIEQSLDDVWDYLVSRKVVKPSEDLYRLL